MTDPAVPKATTATTATTTTQTTQWTRQEWRRQTFTDESGKPSFHRQKTAIVLCLLICVILAGAIFGSPASYSYYIATQGVLAGLMTGTVVSSKFGGHRSRSPPPAPPKPPNPPKPTGATP